MEIKLINIVQLLEESLTPNRYRINISHPHNYTTTPSNLTSLFCVFEVIK